MTPPPTILARLRARRPLVHCLTNTVAAALTANALLSLGASPLMAEDEAEMEAVAGFAGALLINIGMAVPGRMAAAGAAARLASERGTPWVLDPVAAGAIPARTALSRRFIAAGPRVIKGNASEVLALAGTGAGGRGTDATDDAGDAGPAARALATAAGAVVAVTGAVDLVTDGERLLRLDGGHPTMALVSGIGCVAGALIAACLAVEDDAVAATAAALTLFGRAGERAAAAAAGPGSFAPALLDALHGMDGDAPTGAVPTGET